MIGVLFKEGHLGRRHRGAAIVADFLAEQAATRSSSPYHFTAIPQQTSKHLSNRVFCSALFFLILLSFVFSLLENRY
jgi:hypothetical protein